jgi:plastocyanin
MSKTKLFTGLAVAVIITGSIWFLSSNSSQTPAPQTANSDPNPLRSDIASNGTSAPSQNNTPTTPEQPVSQDAASLIPSLTPAKSPGNVKEFIVTAQNFSFAPSTLTVQKGDTVKITLNNTEGFHDFRIDEFNVATKKISGGTQDSVQFVADKTGTFEYYCSVGNHRAMGMKGTLVVQ